MRVRAPWLETLILASLCGAAACKQEGSGGGAAPRTPTPAPEAVESVEAKPPQEAPATGAPASAAAAGGLAPSEYKEAQFDLAIQPVGSYAPGQPAEAHIVLTAKPPYHVNDKYPYKFKLNAAPGLTFPAPVVGKDAVKLEPMRALVPIAFTVQAAGAHVLSGQLAFSVCTEDKCLIEKRDLGLAFDAK